MKLQSSLGQKEKLSTNEQPVEIRERNIRTWLAERESVCPYAPGAAFYRHLPGSMETEQHWAAYFGRLLKTFYAQRSEGKIVERLILIPPTEWTSHDEARTYATDTFWHLTAGYYQQNRLRNKHSDRKSLQAALSRKLEGVDSHEGEGIRNPIVGQRTGAKTAKPHYKSLFCSVFSPLYQSRHHYRYAPSSVIVLVYAQALFEKRLKHPKVTERINLDMIYGNLLEAYRGELPFSQQDLYQEVPRWETLMFELYKYCHPDWRQRCQPEILEVLEGFSASQFNACFMQHLIRLPVLRKLLAKGKVSPLALMKVAYTHAGLYAPPQYLDGYSGVAFGS